MQTVRAVRICDTDGAEQDEFVIIPDDMSTSEATRFVDQAITEIKDSRPDDYSYTDLYLALGRRGFIGIAATPTSQTF